MQLSQTITESFSDHRMIVQVTQESSWNIVVRVHRHSILSDERGIIFNYMHRLLEPRRKALLMLTKLRGAAAKYPLLANVLWGRRH